MTKNRFMSDTDRGLIKTFETEDQPHLEVVLPQSGRNGGEWVGILERFPDKLIKRGVAGLLFEKLSDNGAVLGHRYHHNGTDIGIPFHQVGQSPESLDMTGNG
jgi:hypothetical protein